MLEEKVILVDKNDNQVGLMPKLEAHEKGILHRAFSVFIFNNKYQLLLQKRASSKYHSGGLWTNTCCSHPRKGESLEQATHRRIEEEMGCEADLYFIYRFTYHAAYLNVGAEHEICSVYVGKPQTSVSPNRAEIDAHRWINFEDLDEWVVSSPDAFTPWFKLEWEKLRGTSISTELSVLGRASPANK